MRQGTANVFAASLSRFIDDIADSRARSDMYDVSSSTPGGMSLHGDWFNAWHPEALKAVLDTCIKGALDCHDGNFGTGFRLSGTRPGTQEEPEVVNMGHPKSHDDG